MKKIWWTFMAVVVLAVAVLLIFGLKKECIGCEEKQNDTGSCVSDSDCVKDACCHAKGCVASSMAPNCKGIMCTQECALGTLDCGQGSCKCLNNKCIGVMKENSQIANPASVYCEEQGGVSLIITNDDGSQSGVCRLENGTRCEEWAYYRGGC